MYIGEMASRTGVSARMLRHYESLGLLDPSGRTSAGYRDYSTADLERIFHIESLRSLDMSLEEVGQVLQDPGFTPESLIAELLVRTKQRLRQEQELLTRLRAVRSTAPAAWADVLGVIALLQQLRSPDPAQRQRAGLTGSDAPAVELARAALREAEPNAAGALRWAVLRAGDNALDAVAQGLVATSPEVRQRAVRILIAAGDERYRQALSDPDPTTRGLVALELGRQGQPQATPVLVEMIRTGDRDVAAAEALGAEHLPAVLTALNTPEPRPGERARLTQALAEFTGPEATAALGHLSDDAEPAVRLTARAILYHRYP